jgi:hypothetical protein
MQNLEVTDAVFIISLNNLRYCTFLFDRWSAPIYSKHKFGKNAIWRSFFIDMSSMFVNQAEFTSFCCNTAL